MASRYDVDLLGKQLYDAAGRGDQAGVALALDQGAPIDWRSARDHGWSSLHRAACHGHQSVVRLLLDQKASIDAPDLFILTPLHDAARNGHESVARLLLDRGASINALTKDNETPLHLAARHSNESVVRLLLDRGASIDATDNFIKTPLHDAARNGHESVVRLLLDRGASIDAIDKDNDTPLHFAARNGHESIVRLLLNQGADITIVSVRPCLVVVAAIVTTESPSLTPSIQTWSIAPGTAAQVAKTPSLKQLIGAHSILLFAFLTRLSLSLLYDSQPPILHLTHQPQSESVPIVMVDQTLSLGGGQVKVKLDPDATVGSLKQAIHRRIPIPPTTRTLLLLNNNLEPLQHDDQSLDAIGITDRSSLFITLQGTLSKSFSLHLFLFIIIVTIVAVEVLLGFD